MVPQANVPHVFRLLVCGISEAQLNRDMRRANKLKVLHSAVQLGHAPVDLSMHTFAKADAVTWHAMGFAALQEICVDQLQSANKDLEQLRKKSLQTASSGAG